MNKCNLIVLVFFFNALCFNSQQSFDSLMVVWKDTSSSDSIRIGVLDFFASIKKAKLNPDTAFDFASILYKTAESIDDKKFMSKALGRQFLSLKYARKYDSAVAYGDKLIKLSELNDDKYLMASSYFAVGFVLKKKGDMLSSISYYKKALEIFNDLEAKTDIVKTSNNLGNILTGLGNYNEAIFYYKNSLNLSQKSNDDKNTALSLFNIGNIYAQSNEPQKAINHYNKSLKIAENINYEILEIAISNSISRVLIDLNKIEDALFYLNKSLKKSKEINDVYRECSSLLAFGDFFYKTNDLTKAINYYTECLEKSIKNDFLIIQATVSNNIGEIFLEQSNYKEAEKYLLSAKTKFEKIQIIRGYDLVVNSLYECYKSLGNTAKAFEMLELYIVTHDSLNTLNADKRLYQFEIDKKYLLKNQADSIQHENEILFHIGETAAQKQRSNWLLFITITILLSFCFIFFQFKNVQRKKVIIEIKQKEINDSINYAKRIQQGILPPESFIYDCLPKSFVLFIPKDVVSGDFYWLEKVGSKIYFAVADCTGHGVPGAMVSIVCSNALTKSLFEDNISSPAKILDNARVVVENRFERSGDDIKDGMDISLACLDTNTNKLLWSGANNPLWIVRKNKDIVEEIKATKQSVGKVIDSQPFKEHEVQLDKGDSLYLFSDGFHDQFGGGKGKKLMKGKMKKLILSLSNDSMKNQKSALENEFNSWKGDLEQIDDVCVMGIRI